MKYNKYLLASALVLSGCGVELQESTEVAEPSGLDEQRQQSLNSTETFYAFPADGQADVAVNTSVLLAFSHDIDTFKPLAFTLSDSQGNTVPVTTTRLAENSKGLSFKPQAALLPGERYTASYAVDLIDSNNASEDFVATGEMQFTTRHADNGAVFALDSNGLFPSVDLPFTTFTSLRLRLTNEVDVDSLVLGQSFKFQQVGSDEQVAGQLIAKGRYITFDPSEDLLAGASYELLISDAVKDVNGNSFTPVTETFTARDVGERSFSRMDVTSNEQAVPSPYSGESFNAVTIKSVLIGSEDTTDVNADLITELANLGQFKGSAPLTIRKGTVMNSSELSVKVGGAFSTGFKTGNIRMTTISDATGFLIDNLHSDHKYAPKQLRLLMDVAMTTDGEIDELSGLFANGKANGALSQDIMHLEILGTVRTVGKTMIIDAVGEIDLTILGVENANAQVSFHMESYTETEAENAPVIAVDIDAPFLQSAYPAANTSHFSLGDNITYTFNEPLDTATLANVTLSDSDANVVAARIIQDGSAVVIDPVDALASHTEYTLFGSVTDLVGNALLVNESFTTPYREQRSRQTSPMVEAMVPGYACNMHGYDYTNDIAGKCGGGLDSDQVFNIFSLQENRDIFVAFSQAIDPASLVLGQSCDQGSFRVEIVDINGICQSTVPGRMKYDNKILTFTPASPWQIEESLLYRYALMSAKEKTKGEVDCSAGTVVCSLAGYPLQSSLLKNKSVENQGGPDMRVPFRAIPADNTVFNPLMMATTDTNHDYRWNEAEEPIVEGNFAKLEVTGWSGLITWAKIGCRVGETCSEDKKKTFISAFMPTEVGEYDPVNNRIPVRVHAQQMISSEVFVEAKIIGSGSDVPTGTMVMRPVHPVIDGKTTVPVGYIIWNEEEQRLNFKIDLEVYMDSPFMHVTLDLDHNLHSYKILMNLQGPIEFLEDGRMAISLRNKNSIDLNVSIGGGIAKMTLNLAPGAVSLSQISLPMK